MEKVICRVLAAIVVVPWCLLNILMIPYVLLTKDVTWIGTLCGVFVIAVHFGFGCIMVGYAATGRIPKPQSPDASAPPRSSPDR